jgi:hypothetical protein
VGAEKHLPPLQADIAGRGEDWPAGRPGRVRRARRDLMDIRTRTSVMSRGAHRGKWSGSARDAVSGPTRDAQSRRILYLLCTKLAKRRRGVSTLVLI